MQLIQPNNMATQQNLQQPTNAGGAPWSPGPADHTIQQPQFHQQQQAPQFQQQAPQFQQQTPQFQQQQPPQFQQQAPQFQQQPAPGGQPPQFQQAPQMQQQQHQNFAPQLQQQAPGGFQQQMQAPGQMQTPGQQQPGRMLSPDQAMHEMNKPTTRGEAYEFRMKTGEAPRIITFLDGNIGANGMFDVGYANEHTVKFGPKSFESYQCLNDSGQHCGLCDNASAQGAIGGQTMRGYFTIIDHAGYQAQDGKQFPYNRKLFKAGKRTMLQYLQIAKMLGERDGHYSLAGRSFQVSRTGDKAAAVGDTIIPLERFDLNQYVGELRRLFPDRAEQFAVLDYTKCLSFVDANTVNGIIAKVGSGAHLPPGVGTQVGGWGAQAPGAPQFQQQAPQFQQAPQQPQFQQQAPQFHQQAPGGQPPQFQQAPQQPQFQQQPAPGGQPPQFQQAPQQPQFSNGAPPPQYQQQQAPSYGGDVAPPNFSNQL